jgi:hypothetical protein
MSKMRFLSLVFVLLGVGLPGHYIHAQTDILSKRISLEVSDQTIDSVLLKIERLGQFHFSYVTKNIPTTEKVSFHVTDETVRQILDRLFPDGKMEYLVVEGELILRPSSTKRPADRLPTPTYTISGHIYDRADHETLIGATILRADSNVGTVSNSYGFYSITLPAGIHPLSISYVGYGTWYMKLDLRQDTVCNVFLSEDPSLISEVVIRTTDFQNVNGHRKRLGKVDVRPSTISRIPAFLGEVDVIKSLESMPGISFFGDGSTHFYVRGGNRDQNKILIDDAPIFNPAHLFGLFSNVLPDAVKDVKIYKGDMPAGLGGRLSSVVDIRTRDGNMRTTTFSGSVGLVASHATLEVPLKKDRSALLLSGRHSHFKWLVEPSNPSVESIHFADLTMKLNTIINTRNRLFATFYNGRDKFFNRSGSADASGIRWNNISGSIRWNHLFSDRMFSNTTLYTGNYSYSLVTSENRNDAWQSTISNTGIKTDFSFFVDPSTQIRYGFHLGFFRFNPGNFTYGDPDRNANVPVVSHKRTLEWNAYGDYEKNFGERWALHFGLRATLWQNWGPATEYKFDENYRPIAEIQYERGHVYQQYLDLEPRIGASYSTGPSGALRMGYARNVQHIHQITNSVSPFTSLEVWLPSSPNIKPQKSDQISGGYSRVFSASNLELNIEGYYKWMVHQIDYEYQAQMLINPLLEGELRFGKARSYGFEVFIKKEYGDLTGWIGYGLSKTTKTINGVYGDQPYPAFYDRPHDFSVFLSYTLMDRLTLSGTWIYTSGAAFTTPTSFFYYQGYSVPVYAEKNNDRLPAYHRLDLGIEVRLNRPGKPFRHHLAFGFYNVYARKNPISVNFNKTPTPSGALVVPLNYYLPPALVPTQIWLYRMIPSINYHFEF